jgi:hypothetical protein
MLLSGPTTPEGLAFLQEHADIAIFGTASSEESLEVAEKSNLRKRYFLIDC